MKTSMPAKEPAKKKRGPVPGGKARAAAEAEEEDLIASITGDIARLPCPCGKKTYFESLAELAARNERDIPPALIAEGVLRGVPARELLGAFERNDIPRKRLLLAALERADDLKNKRVCETGEDGEKLQELAMMGLCSELASKRRDMTPPFPGDDAIRETFARWRGIDCKDRWRGTDWADPEQWPTVADVAVLLAMSRAEVGSLARAGRWGFRDVWPGACPRLRGGRPAARLKGKAVAKVLRGFAKKHPGLSADAENLARYLSAIRKKRSAV